MDERFKLLMQVPEKALKKIGAGRLKNFSDINPQWKIEAMTEVYGLCGEGWYYEVADKNEVSMEDGQVLLFMQVNVYVRGKDGWSKPVTGFGGDFIVKRESSGLRANDEAYKMCLTDALGNALKNLGVANDVYRGLWDGSKYTREEEGAIVKEEPLYKIENDHIFILVRGNYYPLERFNLEQLNKLSNDTRFSEIGGEIRQLMSSKAAQ